MLRILASAAVALLALFAPVTAQVPIFSLDQQYQLIKGTSTSKLRKALLEAGSAGFSVQLMSGSAYSLEVIFKRDNVDRKTYLLIDTSRESTFLKELNEAGAKGFRVVPGGAKAVNEGDPTGNGRTTWIAVMAQQPAGRFIYTVVKGVEDGTKALADARKRGVALVSVISRPRPGRAASPTPMLIFEEAQGNSLATVAAPEREFRILATARTSTLETEIRDAAAQGFRVIGAGFGAMTVVMEREPSEPNVPLDYRVIAMARVQTALNELRAAGAAGFKIAAMSESLLVPEGVFVLQRARGTSERVDYQLAQLTEDTADALLRRIESDGYRIAVLYSDLAVLERQQTP